MGLQLDSSAVPSREREREASKARPGRFNATRVKRCPGERPRRGAFVRRARVCANAYVRGTTFTPWSLRSPLRLTHFPQLCEQLRLSHLIDSRLSPHPFTLCEPPPPPPPPFSSVSLLLVASIFLGLSVCRVCSQPRFCIHVFVKECMSLTVQLCVDLPNDKYSVHNYIPFTFTLHHKVR